MPQEGSPKNDALKLLTFCQLNACELLEQQPIKLRHIQSGGIDEGMMAATDTAYLPFFRNREPQLTRQIVIYTVAASTSID